MDYMTNPFRFIYDKVCGFFKDSSLPVTEVCVDSRTLKYIAFFLHQEFQQFADDNHTLVDYSDSQNGKLKVLTSDCKKVPEIITQKLKRYIESTQKGHIHDTIDIRYIKENEFHSRCKIIDVGKAHKVMIEFEDGTQNKLLLIGPQHSVMIGAFEIKKILGLPAVDVRQKQFFAGSKEDPYSKEHKEATAIAQNFQGIGRRPLSTATCFTHRQSGVKVSTAVTDITRMRVDAIVNAANSQLQHHGGVAYAIAEAGGSAVDKECRKYIQRYGELAVSQTCVTTAGYMAAKKIIHTVGPQWRDDKAQECVRLLYDTFTNVLATAQREHCTSVAIPAISSGVYGMPAYYVANTAVRSITDYLNKNSHSSTPLSHIYMVGVDRNIVGDIESQLDSQVQIGMYIRDTHAIGAPAVTPPPMENGFHPVRKTQMNGHNPPFINGSSQSIQKTVASKPAQETKTIDDCCICLDTPVNPKTLPKCKHTFCSDCIDRSFKLKPACPVCGEIYGDVIGDQPQDGQMEVSKDGSNQLPGYEGCGVIVIKYSFSDGTQTADMHSPGQPYSGTHRTAYLPDNADGNKVLKLLKKAFESRLIFTVGRSRTTGANNTVTWNDIHHKTRMTGGAQMFGYPDPTYLARVQDELAAKGIK